PCCRSHGEGHAIARGAHIGSYAGVIESIRVCNVEYRFLDHLRKALARLDQLSLATPGLQATEINMSAPVACDLPRARSHPRELRFVGDPQPCEVGVIAIP